MSDSSDKNGAVLMSKSTNGNFYIEIEHANGDQVWGSRDFPSKNDKVLWRPPVI